MTSPAATPRARGVRISAALLAALLLPLTGCLASEGDALDLDGASVEPIRDFDEDSGALVGAVRSTEQLPVGGARVEILDRGRFTITDLEGLYKFILLPPGAYEVQVRVGDNAPVQASIDVDANRYNTLDFTVSITKPTEYVPYNRTSIERGYVACNVRGEACPAYPDTNDKREFDHPFEGKPIGFLYELTWDRQGPPWLLDPTFREDGFPGGIERWTMTVTLGDKMFTVASSPSYMYLQFNFTTKDEVPEGPAHVLVKTYEAGGFTLPGWAHESDFTLYETVFYVEDQWEQYCAAPPEFCAERAGQGY